MDSNTLDYWKARAEEAERKLKNACEHCGSIKIWASGCPRCSAPVCCDSCCQIADTERRLHIAERKLAAARAEGMEEAAVIAWSYFMDLAQKRRVNPSTMNDEFEVCAAIRAAKEGK